MSDDELVQQNVVQQQPFVVSNKQLMVEMLYYCWDYWQT